MQLLWQCKTKLSDIPIVQNQVEIFSQRYHLLSISYRAFSCNVMLSSNMAASTATEIAIHLCKHLFTLLCVTVSPWTSPFVVQAHDDHVCAWCAWLPWISRSVRVIRRPCRRTVGRQWKCFIAYIKKINQLICWIDIFHYPLSVLCPSIHPFMSIHQPIPTSNHFCQLLPFEPFIYNEKRRKSRKAYGGE